MSETICKRKISFIVPLYKGKKYIKNIIGMISRNVKRIKTEGKTCDVELQFINDCPSENIDIKLEENDFKCRLINNQENIGIQRTRIKGIQECSGDYVVMLDQDDVISDDYLLSQIRTLERKPSAVLIVANGIIEHSQRKRKIYKYGFMHRTVRDIRAYAYMDNRIESPGQCLIRKDAIPSFWFDHPLKNNGSDDYMLWLLLLSSISPKDIALNGEMIYTHVNTGENLSLSSDTIYRSVREVTDILRKSSIVDDTLLDIITYRLQYMKDLEYSGKLNLFRKMLVRWCSIGSKALLQYRER